MTWSGLRQLPRTRRPTRSTFVAALACILLAGCAARAESGPGKPSVLAQVSILSPGDVAHILGRPEARRNLGLHTLGEMREPLSSCGLPLGKSLQWVLQADRAAMYDVSTYDNAPAAVDGVITIMASFPVRPSDPLALAAQGLRDCGVAETTSTVHTDFGDLKALQFHMGAPPEESSLTGHSVREADCRHRPHFAPRQHAEGGAHRRPRSGRVEARRIRNRSSTTVHGLASDSIVSLVI